MDRYVIKVTDEEGNTKFLGYDKSRIVAYDNPFVYPILFKSADEAKKSSSLYIRNLPFKVVQAAIMKITIENGLSLAI